MAGGLGGCSAAGLDGIPPEVYRHTGLGLFQLLGRIVHQAFESGVPDAWRGGRMAPVPKGTGTVLSSFASARGIFCSAVSCKLFAKALRAGAVPALAVWLAGSKGRLPAAAPSSLR